MKTWTSYDHVGALARLRRDVDRILASPAERMMPLLVRKLVDSGISPVVVAKHLLIGDRDGGVLYMLSNAKLSALSEQETASADMLALAWCKLHPRVAALWAAVGASWLVTQFGVSRPLLVDWAKQPWPARLARPSRHGYGVIDLLEHEQAGSREWLVEVLANTSAPLHAPMTFKPRTPEDLT